MTSTLLSVEQASEQLLSQLDTQAQTELCSLHVATWRVLAENVISPVGIPVNHLSMMDGYAVCAQEIQPHQPYPISQRVAAGEVSQQPLASKTVARIFTGAMLPPNADTVVMQEHAQYTDDQQIIFTSNIEPGQYVRHAHSEVQPRQQLLTKGTRLTPQAVALCASVGIPQLLVYRPLTIGLLVTGSELVEPGQPLTTGKTYNANLYLIESLLRAHGYDVASLGIVPDNLAATKQRLLDATSFDAIITTGGVSVGEEDYVRRAVSELGHIDAWKVRMKPGKPFAYGHVQATPYFGLPGNPVSAFATFHLFVLPALKKLQGLTEPTLTPEFVIADFDFSAGDRREYLRAKIVHQNQKRYAQIHPNQNSSVLGSTVWADGFVPVDEGTHIRVGDIVSFIPFNAFRQ